jgi:hypothetical protein
VRHLRRSGTKPRFREAADVWLGKIRERRTDSTADTYASCLKNQVLPQLRELRLVVRHRAPAGDGGG